MSRLLFLLFITYFLWGTHIMTSFARPNNVTQNEHKVETVCRHHNITFGRRLPRDRWAFSTVIKRNKSISRRTTVQVQYSQNRWKKCKISLISVRNLRTQCNCFRESVRITNGGPGNTFMKLNISSEINCDIHSNVTLYIKC